MIQQDVWSETSKLLVNFWGADLCGFGERRSNGEIVVNHLTFSAELSNRAEFASEVQEDIAAVLDSGFLTWRFISPSPKPLVVAFLPVTHGNQVANALLVGHVRTGSLPKDLLNIYLALAGLVGATVERLTSEVELRKHRRHLEVLVGERTAELTKTNEQLQHEIIHRQRAEEALQKAHNELEFRVQQRTAQLKNAREAIAVERQRLFDILEAMPVMVCLLTPDYHVAFANRSCRERFGADSGRHCFDYRFGLKEPCEFCEACKVLKTGKPHHWEFSGPDGSVIDAYDFPFTDTDGSPLILEVEIDITERKQAEMERERLITELATKNAELQRFTYSVSHDLRSPLITIRTFLGFVAEAVSNGNTQNLDADLDRIDKAAEKMGQLLGEILELSRVGRISNPPSEVLVEDLVKEVLELLSGRIAQHELEVQIAANLPVLYVDRPRVLEVFQNLIENSIKFMGDQPKPRIEIGATENGEEAVFFVRDNGSGINPAYQDKVFGLFSKLDSESEGSGVGLALVKRIVEVHDGRIWVESEGAGKGTTFCFTLPCLVPSADLH
jgi:signal transduction histidine kinase